MTGIRIIVQTEKADRIVRKIMRAGTGKMERFVHDHLVETVENDAPLRVRLEHKSAMSRRFLRTAHLHTLIERQLKKHGLVPIVDYRLEKIR